MSSTVYFPATEKYPYKRKWDLEFIWDISSSLEVEEVSVEWLWETRYKLAWCWQHENEEINNDFFLHHMQRVMEADLHYPVILSEENLIFDGVHRLMKAKFLGIKTIRCVKFNYDPAPTFGSLD